MTTARGQRSGHLRRRRPRWGQNFLIDRATAHAIVDWAAVDGKAVLEIGPGRGALTGLLVERASELVLVEIDSMLTARLQEAFRGHARVRVLGADVLTIDPATVAGVATRVVANLPYDRGTTILMRLLSSFNGIEEMVLMLQREVCERIAAQPGTKAYGQLSIQVQIRAEVELGRVVSATCFRPQPKVQSRLLRIRPLARPRYPLGEESHFRCMLAAAFSQRRKKLRNGLAAWLRQHVDGDDDASVLGEARIDPGARPEDVPVEAFAALAALTYKAAGEPCPNCLK